MIRLTCLGCLLTASGLLTGCGQRSAPEWLPASAWWIEDRVRGLPREAGELRRDDAGRRTERLALWVEGDRIFAHQHLPDLLHSRESRWSAVSAGLAGGSLNSRHGLLTVTATGADRAALLPLAEAENRDRLRSDAIVAALLDLDAMERQRFAVLIEEIRGELDRPAARPALTAGSPPAP